MSSLENDYDQMFDLDDFREEKQGVEYYIWKIWNCGFIAIGGMAVLISLPLFSPYVFAAGVSLVTLGQITDAIQDIRAHSLHESHERRLRKWNTAQKKKLLRREQRERRKQHTTSVPPHVRYD